MQGLYLNQTFCLLWDWCHPLEDAMLVVLEDPMPLPGQIPVSSGHGKCEVVWEGRK